MKKIYEIKIDNEENIRLDKFLSDNIENISRTTIQNLINKDSVKVNGKSVKMSYKIVKDDYIEVFKDEDEESHIKPQKIDLDIIYEDKDIAVINKPQGMVVHPAPGNKENTLVNALLYHLEGLSSINGVKRPGIVHRLDKDTSGLLMIAKNDYAHNFLSNQLKDKTANRTYYALVEGIIREEKGKINIPLKRDSKSKIKMAASFDGKPATTNFEVVERFSNQTLIKCMLETGRTHQIRVHLSYIGFPIIGDVVYGSKKQKYGNKQFLHAYELSFIHPSTNKRVTFNAPIPNDFEKLLEKLRLNNIVN